MRKVREEQECREDGVPGACPGGARDRGPSGGEALKRKEKRAEVSGGGGCKRLDLDSSGRTVPEEAEPDPTRWACFERAPLTLTVTKSQTQRTEL